MTTIHTPANSDQTERADQTDQIGPIGFGDLPYDEPVILPATGSGPKPDPAAGRAKWPVYGLLAAVNGLISSFMILGSGITEEDAQQGVGVIQKLERGNFRIGSILGMVAIGLLFVTVAAWRRWLERIAPDDLAARTIPTALAGIPILNVFFVSMAATMVLYLPGGTDHGWLSDEALFVNFSMLDFGPLLGWWGAVSAEFFVGRVYRQPPRGSHWADSCTFCFAGRRSLRRCCDVRCSWSWSLAQAARPSSRTSAPSSTARPPKRTTKRASAR